MSLARELTGLEAGIRTSPWPDHEHVRGYAVMMLPFSSGHLLGLRVFPQTDFGPYASVWHRDPAGAWSIYNDGRSLGGNGPRSCACGSGSPGDCSAWGSSASHSSARPGATRRWRRSA